MLGDQPTTSLVATYSDNWLSVQTEQVLTVDTLNNLLLVLQTAFPAVVRGYDEYEFTALQSLWYDIFKNVPEDVMREAIKRFIINDRKGFFPSPGQIVGCIEDMVEEEKKRQRLAEFDMLIEASERQMERERQKWREAKSQDNGVLLCSENILKAETL